MGFTIGTQGQGDQCAPSRLISTVVHYSPPLDAMVEYEAAFIAGLLAQGIAVVVTDYEGLGTPAMHTYLNPIAEAHANIDAVRAAQRLPGSGLPATGPVAFWGYSQGGGAAAATAERVGEYAPELDVRGTYAGAPPADIDALLTTLDGTALVGVTGYYLNGLAAAYPETRPIIDAELNAAGKAMTESTRNECSVETMARHGFQRTAAYTSSGRPLFPDVMMGNPITRRIVEEHRVGNLTPSAPVLLTTGNNDDIVPAGSVRALAASWCAKGATVQLAESATPALLPASSAGHIVNALTLSLTDSFAWLRARLTGAPAPTTCD